MPRVMSRMSSDGGTAEVASQLGNAERVFGITWISAHRRPQVLEHLLLVEEMHLMVSGSRASRRGVVNATPATRGSYGSGRRLESTDTERWSEMIGVADGSLESRRCGGRGYRGRTAQTVEAAESGWTG